MSIKCKFFYARSLKNKLCELHYTLYSSYLSIIWVAESWLNDSITNAMLDPQGLFDIYRRDRPSHAGGVIALVLKSLNSSGVFILPTFDDLECVIFDIRGVHCKFRFFL